VSYNFIKEKFDNEKKAKCIKCPAMVIHGKSDALISYKSANSLYKRFILQNFFNILFSLNSQRKICIYPELMTHNDFNFE